MKSKIRSFLVWGLALLAIYFVADNTYTIWPTTIIATVSFGLAYSFQKHWDKVPLVKRGYILFLALLLASIVFPPWVINRGARGYVFLNWHLIGTIQSERAEPYIKLLLTEWFLFAIIAFCYMKLSGNTKPPAP